MITFDETLGTSDFERQADATVVARLKRLGLTVPAEAGARFLKGVDLLDDYLERLQSGAVPQLYQLGEVLDGIEIGGELITIIGAPPGQGKTCLAMQILFEAVEHNPELLAYVANAEMGFDSLIRRELTRMTGISNGKIRFGDLTGDEHVQISGAAAKLRCKLERIEFDPEADHESLLGLLDRPPGLVVVDYLQKFAPPHKEVRVGVNSVMTTLRRLARAGHAVLALSATKRDAKGNHDSRSLSLSSFRESGECEYQADSAYVMQDDGPSDENGSIRLMTLGHVKNRHGAKIDRGLLFNMPAMRFETRPESAHTDFGFEESAGNENPFA